MKEMEAPKAAQRACLFYSTSRGEKKTRSALIPLRSGQTWLRARGCTLGLVTVRSAVAEVVLYISYCIYMYAVSIISLPAVAQLHHLKSSVVDDNQLRSMNNTSRDGGDTRSIPLTCHSFQAIHESYFARLSRLVSNSKILTSSPEVKVSVYRLKQSRPGRFSVVSTHGLCSNGPCWDECIPSDMAITTSRPSVILKWVQDTCFIDYPFKYARAHELFWSWSSLFRR